MYPLNTLSNTFNFSDETAGTTPDEIRGDKTSLDAILKFPDLNPMAALTALGNDVAPAVLSNCMAPAFRTWADVTEDNGMQ